MGLKSLRSKLLVAVAGMVTVSGLLTSLLVTQQYSNGLLAAFTAQAESLAHAVALEATDKILINDLVALQKMLDHEMSSNAALAYIFIVRDGKLLAHTFGKGMPTDLIEANHYSSPNQGHLQKIVSTQGERYLDIAWPIFSGRAGVLRLGFSETPYRRQVRTLWLRMSIAVSVILLLALAGTLAFVRRITDPLSKLVNATQRLDRGDLDVTVTEEGDDEVAALAFSFNHMVARVKEYTHRLENKAMELERSHNQTRSCCEIVREIGAMPTFHEIGPALIRRFQNMLRCHDMVLLVLTADRSGLYVVSESGVNLTRDSQTVRLAGRALALTGELTFVNRRFLVPPLLPPSFRTAPRQAIIPFSDEGYTVGGLLVGCPEGCACDPEEIEVVGHILKQAAGVIRRALLHEESSSDLRARIEKSGEFCGIIGKDPRMQAIYRLIEDMARTDATVLIQGESGTGKELVAGAIHRLSDRRDHPFVVINCSAYPDTLLESELFGHEKGAFTGAIRQKIGRFEQAHHGTVFLDEIGEIPLPGQINLLRVLQTQQFERLGGERTLSVDVRVLAATNKNLLKEVQRGNFREDLFYRINVIPILVPPLRDRPNDIPLLANHFLSRMAAEQGKEIRSLSPDVMRKILNYSWPGNVRELENSIEHAVVLAKGNRIEIADLPAVIRGTTISSSLASVPLLVETERALLESVLVECKGNKQKAARRLGICRTTLYSKLKKYQIVDPTLQ